MTFKQFIITMIFITLVVWGGWFFLIFKIDPIAAEGMDFLFFYATLAAALIGSLTILGTAGRRLMRPLDLVSRQVLISFRQAFWLTTIIISALFLLANIFFHLWIIALIILIFAFIELAFLNAKSRRIF